MKKPIRVAQIMGKWVGGGVEAVVMNYYRNIDKSKIKFDFIFDEDSNGIPAKEIKELGGEIILIPPYQKVFKYHRELKKVLEKGKYQIVHSHVNTLSVFSLWAAKSAKVPVRIAHSHSTTNKQEKKKNLLKQVLRPFSKVFATHYFACTEHAGKWMFGNKEYEKGNIFVMNNAIDLDKFKYSKVERNKIRKELNIKEDTLVVGHIGRFVKQKNHEFILEIFKQIQKKNINSVLMLVGQGPLMEDIKLKVKENNLEDKVIFLGQREDNYRLYQAFDVFLFPSLYEGLGMVLIESQTAGLSCVTSTEVPSIAKVTNLVEFLDLTYNGEYWANVILDLYENNERKSHIKEVQKSGYDIELEVEKLEEKYLKIINIKNIELYGLPGCGKSTYYEKNLKIIKNLNVIYFHKGRIIRNFLKILYVVVIKILYRETNRTIKAVVNKFTFNNIKAKIKMSIYLYSTMYVIEKEKKHNYVLDEGLLQVLWAFCYNSNYDINDIAFYLSKLKKNLSDRIIYLDIEKSTIINRLKERNNFGGSELEHDIKKNNDSIEKAKKIEIEIINYVNENLNIEVIKQ